MGLSKKNFDKLNSFSKKKNLSNDSKVVNTYSDNNHKNSKDLSELNNPKNIFYSLIDNSETLSETCKVNYYLRNSEKQSKNINYSKTNHSNQLTPEDELYDEFNYLLEE